MYIHISLSIYLSLSLSIYIYIYIRSRRGPCSRWRSSAGERTTKKERNKQTQSIKTIQTSKQCINIAMRNEQSTCGGAQRGRGARQRRERGGERRLPRGPVRDAVPRLLPPGRRVAALRDPGWGLHQPRPADLRRQRAVAEGGPGCGRRRRHTAGHCDHGPEAPPPRAWRLPGPRRAGGARGGLLREVPEGRGRRLAEGPRDRPAAGLRRPVRRLRDPGRLWLRGRGRERLHDLLHAAQERAPPAVPPLLRLPPVPEVSAG